MYQVCGSDKLYSDEEFPIQNVNVDKIEKVFKLVEVVMSKIENLLSSKQFLNFQKDKAYYNKPRNPCFNNKNQNNGSNGQWGGKQNQKRSFQKSNYVKKLNFVKISSSLVDQESEIFTKSNEEFFAQKKYTKTD
ncbi:hypothetical protein Hanom_Chr14g01264421 [Helianthus anomalus]